MSRDSSRNPHGFIRGEAQQIGCKRSQMSRWCAGITRPNRYWWARVTAWSRGAITADVPKREKETT